MLRLTMKTDDYIQIGDNIRIVFLGGSKSHQKIMIDAPKDVAFVRGSVLEKNAVTENEKKRLPQYYPSEK